MKAQIERLTSSSRKVLKRCSSANGAILASYSQNKETKDYRYVWPRDAAYICIAADILGLEIQENFFNWCLKAEGWESSGLFYKNYHPDGRMARKEFQPDQNGILLIALHDYYAGKKIPKRFERLIRKSADGLCKVWSKEHFSVVTQDLWEERLCFPDLKENFNYSLAVCSQGLKCANQLLSNKRWVQTAEQMRKVLPRNQVYRTCGRLKDEGVDASLLGLAWPGRINKDLSKTVGLIEEKIVIKGGVHRYEQDQYDGWIYKDFQRKKGAGYWPLLNFWMAIYYAETGNRKKALQYYYKVLHNLKSDLIPEQIFDNNIQKSVTPLAWSHAMFVIASRKLGFI